MSKNNYSKGKNSRGKKPYDKRGRNGSKQANTTPKREDAAPDEQKEQYHSSIGITDGRKNDMEWYSQYPALIADAGRMNFARIAGLDLSLGVGEHIVHANDIASLASWLNTNNMPGIMAMDVFIGPGVSDSFDSAYNVSMQNAYSFIRHANSGSRNYEFQDLGLYYTSMDSAYTFLASMIRIYGLLRLYSVRNRYLPLGLLTALGISQPAFNNLIGDLPNFREYINTFTLKLMSLAVPRDIKFFNRHQFMFGGVYKDEDSDLASLYVFKPRNLYIYEVGTEGGFCRSIDLPDTTWNNISSIRTFGDVILSHLRSQEDIGIISGDILKAYGSEGLWKGSEIDPLYTVIPVYNPQILEQIHNATCCLFPSSFNNVGNITQVETASGNYLVSKPEWYVFPEGTVDDPDSVNYRLMTHTIEAYMADRLITVHSPEPTVEDVVEATRLMTIPNYCQSEKGAVGLAWDSQHPYMTEILGPAYTIRRKPGTNADLVASYEKSDAMAYYTADDAEGSSLLFSIPDYSRIGNFVDHPRFIFQCVSDALYDKGDGAGVLDTFDVDNYTVMTQHTLKPLHDACILSLYHVPGMSEMA